MSEAVAEQQSQLPTRVDGQIGKEFIRRGTVLWENGICQVIAPERPLTSKKEGLHLRLVLRENLPPVWDRKTDIKKILQGYGISVGVAKVLAESGISGTNFWANIQLNGEWGGQFEPVIDIFGRSIESPQGGETWAQPVKMPNSDNLPYQEMTEVEKARFKRLFKSYLPLWEKEMKNVDLYSDEKLGEYPDCEKLPENLRSSGIAWVSTSYYIDHADRVQLPQSGWLGIHRRPDAIKLRKPWQNLKQALEMMGVDITVLQLLWERGIIPGNRPNFGIHYSGNWALPYRLRGIADPKSDLSAEEFDFLSRVNKAIMNGHDLKRYKVEARDQFFRIHAHGHLYWLFDPNRALVLPPYPDPLDKTGKSLGRYPWSSDQKPLQQTEQSKISEILKSELGSRLGEISGRLT